MEPKVLSERMRCPGTQSNAIIESEPTVTDSHWVVVYGCRFKEGMELTEDAAKIAPQHTNH